MQYSSMSIGILWYNPFRVARRRGLLMRESLAFTGPGSPSANSGLPLHSRSLTVLQVLVRALPGYVC
jgi:hypothetical protein